jgi:hypothetical protein
VSAFRTVSKNQLRTRPDERVEEINLAPVSLHTKAEFVREIAGLWKDAQSRFLAIGRYLVQARATLAREEYDVMVERELPFSASIAVQLRSAAEAIDGGRLDVARLPPSYSTVYQLAKLSDDDLKRAEAAGLVRPDVKRAEVLAFTRQLRVAPADDVVTSRRESLLAEKARLQQRIIEIEAELAGMIDEDQS